MIYLRGVKRSKLLGSSPATTARDSRVTQAKAMISTKRATPPSSNPDYRPLRVRPPQTAVERAVNQALTKNSSQGLTSLAAETFPPPATSATFRAIGAADSQSATLFAMAFTQDLLDIDFATATRDGLLAWANFNRAPNTLTALPASLSRKVLCASLTTRPSPVPTFPAWKRLATSDSSWRVSGLVVSVNPTWTQALSAGWQSVDPLMVIYDVSGVLTMTTPGHQASVESVSFALTLGGASLHSGYGAVALDYWTVN
jgi:hypothetical protein